MSNETLVSRDRVNVDTNQLIGFWAELVSVLFLRMHSKYFNICYVPVLRIRYQYLLTLLSPADLQPPILRENCFLRPTRKDNKAASYRASISWGGGGVEGVIIVNLKLTSGILYTLFEDKYTS